MVSLAEKHALERAKRAKLESSARDPHSNIHGVLLSDEIELYVQNCNLIDPFDRANLKPAAYELTVGDEYFISGEFLTLESAGKENSKIIIPPFEVAVLKTTELLCLPRYLIGRWNIRVKHAYSGLLWVGGPQVDPGYVGFLFCPIYNLSDKPVTLNVGDRLLLFILLRLQVIMKGDPSRTQRQSGRFCKNTA
jgi:deoxycytidine triphosphate deaminase